MLHKTSHASNAEVKEANFALWGTYEIDIWKIRGHAVVDTVCSSTLWCGLQELPAYSIEGNGNRIATGLSIIRTKIKVLLGSAVVGVKTILLGVWN